MPDLILLDLQMPVMGGFAVIRELRKTPELSKLKVIAVTSFAMKGDRGKALEAGFDEYVTKPIDTRKFVEIVKNILPSENMTLKKPIILCVDDGPANIKLLENILVPRGYEVVSAANGEDALLKIKTRTIDLVLLDLMLPGMDGLQVSRKIKDNKKYRNIPIIMLTAYSGVESYIKSLSGEVFAYLHKPFEAEELVGIVRAALGQLEAGPGNNDAQVKFQISMKFRVLEPNLYVLKYNLFPAYVAYTQKSLWNVGQQSMPVEESNYNPEFFLDYPVNAVIIGRFKLRNMVISPIEHESNGLAGVQSRGWNRQYVLIKFGLESKEKLEVTNSFLSDKALLYVNLWYAWGYSGQDAYLQSIGSNDKFLDYMGHGELGVSVRNFLWGGSLRDHQLDIKTPIFRDKRKNSYEFEFRQQLPNMNFALYLQYWHGYGETLMRFDQFGRRGFVGLAFSY